MNALGERPVPMVQLRRCPNCGHLMHAAGAPPITSAFASASLCLGLLSFAGGFATGVLAVIFGILALIQIRRDPKFFRGRNIAFVGILSGFLFSVMFMAFVWLSALGN